jgi:hypothetical protein
MIVAGITIEPIVTEALARAGYGPHAVPAVMDRMAIHLLTLNNLTPERVADLADTLIPGIIQTLAEEIAAVMPSVAVH